jgi:hypothetical protein
MTIRIGSPSTPRGITLGSAISTTLKLAGIAAVAYGGASALGIFAELANHKDAAAAVCHMMTPAVKMTNAVYGGLANAAGLGQAVKQSPPVDQLVQLAGSGVMATVIGGVLSMVGAKLSRAVEQSRANVQQTPAPRFAGHTAVSKLAALKGRWASNGASSLEADTESAPAETSPTL